MDKYDRAKLKVLIKMILLQKSPRKLTGKQLENIINKDNWGFRTSVNQLTIIKLLKSELNRTDNHFMNCIQKSKKRNGTLVFFIKLD